MPRKTGAVFRSRAAFRMNLDRLDNWFVRVVRLGVGLSFSVLILAVATQVLGRLYGSAPVWTEELTRYALLYTIAFGSGLALRSGDLVNVNMVCDSLPGNLPKVFRLVSSLLTFALCVYLLPFAWKYVSIGGLQTSPALGLRMDFVHFTVWLTFLGLALFSCRQVARTVFSGANPEPANRDSEH